MSTGNQTTAPPLAILCTLEPKISSPRWLFFNRVIYYLIPVSLSDDIDKTLRDNNQNDETLPFDTMTLTDDPELHRVWRTLYLSIVTYLAENIERNPPLHLPSANRCATFHQTKTKNPLLQYIQKQEVIQTNISQMLELGYHSPKLIEYLVSSTSSIEARSQQISICLNSIRLKKACNAHGWPIPNNSQSATAH